jgi:hypothetical protein
MIELEGGVFCQIWDIGRVLVENFNWLPFTHPPPSDRLIRSFIFSRQITVLAGASQFLAILWPAPHHMLLLHLPRLLRPNHGLGRD